MTLSHSQGRKDAELIKSIAMPAADGTVVTPSIDLGPGSLLAPAELLLDAPVLTVTELPDADTATYKLQHSADDSSWSDLETGVITQTGAGGAGAAATNIRRRIASTTLRYVRASVTTAGVSGDMSGKSMTFSLLT